MSFKSIFFYVLLGFFSLFSSITQAEQAVIAKHISTHQSSELIKKNAANPEFEIIDVRTVGILQEQAISISTKKIFSKTWQNSIKTKPIYCIAELADEVVSL